jgi:hypothetical protein
MVDACRAAILRLVSVFIFDRHGVQELPSAHTIIRTGLLVKVLVEKREPHGEPAAIVRLAKDTIVSLANPEKELSHDPQSYPRHAGRAPGVYVRLGGETHAFPAQFLSRRRFQAGRRRGIHRDLQRGSGVHLELSHSRL